jgi:hypothetical protein
MAESAIKYVATKTICAAKRLMTQSQPMNWWLAFILPGMFLNVRAAAGTYTKGQPVLWPTVRSKPRRGAAIRAYVEEDKAYTVVQAICFASCSSKEH